MSSLRHATIICSLGACTVARSAMKPVSGAAAHAQLPPSKLPKGRYWTWPVSRRIHPARLAGTYLLPSGLSVRLLVF